MIIATVPYRHVPSSGDVTPNKGPEQATTTIWNSQLHVVHVVSVPMAISTDITDGYTTPSRLRGVIKREFNGYPGAGVTWTFASRNEGSSSGFWRWNDELIAESNKAPVS